MHVARGLGGGGWNGERSVRWRWITRLRRFQPLPERQRIGSVLFSFLAGHPIVAALNVAKGGLQSNKQYCAAHTSFGNDSSQVERACTTQQMQMKSGLGTVASS